MSQNLVMPPGTESSVEEVEIKLQLLGEGVVAFRLLDILKRQAGQGPRTVTLKTTYFDSPDMQLRTHGLELQVQQVKNVWTQSLKTTGHACAGLYRHRQWNTAVSGSHPELRSLLAQVACEPTGIETRCNPQFFRRLAPVFTSMVQRTVWVVHLTSGSSVNVVLDHGELQARRKREPFCEVRLKLKNGEITELFDFALQLLDQLPLRIGKDDEAERGYEMLAPAPIFIARAQPVQLASNLSVESCFTRIAWNCLAQIEDNERGVIESSDPESVHQMRVGLRRLRSAIRLFSQSIRLPAKVHEELEWLGETLGSARDADVLANITLPALGSASSTASGHSWTPLLRAAKFRAQVTRQDASAGVASVRYSRLILSIGAWLHARHERLLPKKSARTSHGKPIGKWAARRLEKLQTQLFKMGARHKKSSITERHRMRIAAKELRYALEFFESICSMRRLQPYLKCLIALQDVLGRLNDGSVADKLLGRMGKAGKPGSAVARLSRQARKRIARDSLDDRRKLQKCWRHLKHARRSPWNAGSEKLIAASDRFRDSPV
ncbi:MAG: CYTH and CHAD domain-containing protein [Pseudomonadota bacterium]